MNALTPTTRKAIEDAQCVVGAIGFYAYNDTPEQMKVIIDQWSRGDQSIQLQIATDDEYGVMRYRPAGNGEATVEDRGEQRPMSTEDLARLRSAIASERADVVVLTEDGSAFKRWTGERSNVAAALARETSRSMDDGGMTAPSPSPRTPTDSLSF